MYSKNKKLVKIPKKADHFYLDKELNVSSQPTRKRIIAPYLHSGKYV